MNDKLELKDLVGYLPYGLKCQLPKHQVRYGQQEILELNGLSLNSDKTVNPEFLLTNDDLLFGTEIKWWKPILRPLSDLVKEIEVDGHRIVPAEKIFPKEWSDFKRGGMRIDMMFPWNRLPKIWRYIDFVQLLELHFDVFGLIKRGLAVDINTI